MKKIISLIWLIASIVCIPKVCSAQSKTLKINLLIEEFQKKSDFSGSILVAKGSTIITKKAFGYANIEWAIPNHPSTRFCIASVTKPFTALRIMQLVEDGKIDLNKPIGNYLPQITGEETRKVTIHQLLSHTSGIPDFIGPDATKPDQELILDSLIKALSQVKPAFEPGSQFRYANSTYILLAFIIEQLTAKPYHQNLQEFIFNKAGMNNSGCERPGEIIKNYASGYIENDGVLTTAPYSYLTPIFKGAGAMYSTVEDLYAWDQALYTEVLLSHQAKERMFTAVKDPYGYGWFIRNIPGIGKMLSHEGGFGGYSSLVVRIPHKQYFVAILSNKGPNNQLHKDLVKGIIQVLEER
jgi:CubicO group peptidase (beta-lactamase class C family)